MTAAAKKEWKPSAFALIKAAHAEAADRYRAEQAASQAAPDQHHATTPNGEANNR